MEPYRDYRPHLEYGAIVWYRTTRTKSVSYNMKSGKEQRVGTLLDRIITSTADYSEACKQLDRRLLKPNKEKEGPGPNQLPMFDEETS